MLLNTLKRAVEQIQELEAEVEQIQKDNDKLTEDIKKLEDEQREGYKTFNTETHILLERCELNDLINDIDDCASSADCVADECNSARGSIEDVDTYSIEEAENNAKHLMRDTQKISDKLQDLLYTKDVQPLAEEGAENE